MIGMKWISYFWQDFLFRARNLLKTRGFTAVGQVIYRHRSCGPF